MPSQLGWRLPNADEALFEPLFRRGYAERLHVLPHGEVTNKWAAFVDDLYQTEEGFIGKDKKSVKSVKEQWDLKIRRFKERFGWLNGSVSPHLTAKDKLILETSLYKTIHQVVYELWEHDKKKRVRGKKARLEAENAAITMLSVPASSTSTDIFDNQKKRKVVETVDHEATPGGTKSSAASTAAAASAAPAAAATAATAAIDDKEYLAYLAAKNMELRVPPESALEARIVKKVKKESGDFNPATLVELAKVDLATADLELFSNFTLLINIFCSPGKNFEPEFVKNSFKEIGLSTLDAHKVYFYLNRIKNALL